MNHATKPLVWEAVNSVTRVVCVDVNQVDCLDEVDLLRALATKVKAIKKKDPNVFLSTIVAYGNDSGPVVGLTAYFDAS